ncbi:hypothetical protein KUCAC02_019917 [Chaenocephalus aceratus]|uniref:Uncharacterized protein n=1 Tax=Chaenocephalus aceratus TaxID=36190 RepID=A0ACB9VQL3_CHAAC|nr:hypothetical protein KUCAC02_019917 [Chaenocephalus aceratus]
MWDHSLQCTKQLFEPEPYLLSQEHNEEESFLPHIRGKRSGLLAQVEYDVDVELNLTDIGTVDVLRSILDAGGFSLALGPTVNVTHITITTVPLVFYEYQIIIEVYTSDADQLRTVLNSLPFPVQISSSVNILDANITTEKKMQWQSEKNEGIWP